jgi:hypothetical protein
MNGDAWRHDTEEGMIKLWRTEVNGLKKRCDDDDD